MLVTLVGFAFLFGILISRMGLPPMVGFLVAGFAYNFAGLEAPTGLQLVADLGVTLLLFSIGLKLKLKDLATSEVWGTSVLHIAASTLFFALAIFAGQALFQIPIFNVSPLAVIAIAFALSFSSTVYAVKVLEDKGDMSALYGKIAIGILVMQDIFAVIFLAVSEGKYPSVWAFLVFALLLPPVKKLIYKLIDQAGHGELLVVSGLFFALGVGYEFFYAVQLKGDLGALILGVLISNHPKAKELAKSLFSFKELMLVGFFLSVGMQGLPTVGILVTALALVLLLPIKTFLYYYCLTRFGLRARTSLFASLGLGNFSEFGLIVAGLGVTQGWLPVDWLIIIAIAVSISFAAAAPFSRYAEETYQRYRLTWGRFQKSRLHPKDEIMDTGNAKVLIVGMGRVGSGAYTELEKVRPGLVLGVELSEERAAELRAEGLNVKAADATDTDFWNMVRESATIEEMVVLAMPNHRSNIEAAERIRASDFQCQVVAIAKHQSEVEELLALNIPSFNLYAEAGNGLGKEAIALLPT